MDCVLCQKQNCPKAYYACGHMTCICCEALENCSADGKQNVSSEPLVAGYLQYIQLADSEESAKLIHVQIINIISSLANCSRCQTCGNYLRQDGVCCVCIFYPELPTYRGYTLLNGFSRCPRCSREYTGPLCACGYVNISCIKTVRQLTVTKPSTTEVAINNPCWTCSNCSYEYNMQNACLMCRYPKENPATAQSLPVVGFAVDGWRCPNCPSDNPRYRGRCVCGWYYSPPDGFPQSAQVQYSFAAPFPQSLPTHFKSPEVWSCRYCTYGYNQPHMQGCCRCFKPRYSREV